MSYNFPNTPTIGQIFSPSGGPIWRWNGNGWEQIPPPASTGLPEAPVDGEQYARSDGTWEVVADPAWADISGKPATFPPTLPIAQADVTGLVAGQSAQDTAIGTKLNSSAYTAADVLTKIKTVDGAASGLDADLLDGNDSAFFATATALSGKEPTIAGGTTAQYWRGDKSWQTLPASGIADAPNDASAYVRSALAWVVGYTKAAIDTLLGTKEPTIAAGTAAQYWQGTKTWQTLNSSAVGLGSVDNTSDVDKPVSTAQATADALAVLKSGSTMSGDLILFKATPSISLQASNGTSVVGVYLNRGTSSRWTLIKDNTAESANTGADFRIGRYNDAGTLVDYPFFINRGTGQITLYMNVATPAGGNAATAGVKLGSAGPGIYFGSGAPTLTAPQGSLYLRTDGSSNVTRMYVNTTGAAVWTACNTVA